MLRRLSLLVLVLVGCNLSRNKPALVPTNAVTQLAPTLQGAWNSTASGVELRTMKVGQSYASLAFDAIVIRLDPALVSLRVHYVPQEWSYMVDWVERLDDPLMIVNANFFDPKGEAVGLVVSDGQSYGQSFFGFGGMLQIDKDSVRLRSLRQEPYQFELLNQAVQGFPMLVDYGGVPARTGEGFDDPARRTMVAQDSRGRLLFVITPYGALTLRNAQQWLLESELDIQVAFGLDGGKSTGMYVNTPEGKLIYNSFDPVPAVIAVYPRQ